MRYYDIIPSPVGELLIAEKDGALTHVLFLDFTGKFDMENNTRKRTSLLDACAVQLREYFDGKRKIFDLPLKPEGTEFQLKDWNALREIPYGETRSYKDIAIAIGNPKACRAVGTANHNNPISIIIPCHRVIGSDGSLTGYGGGLDKKTYLLELEQKNRS